jgi:glycerate dehydrogenase
MKIVVLDGHTINPGDLSWDGLRELGELTTYDRTPRELLAERVADADIVVSSKVVWDSEALALAPKLRLIALLSTGYDVVDIEAASKQGVTVCNVPAYSSLDVVQSTFSLLLELLMHAGSYTEEILDGAWTRSPDFCYWNAPLIECAGLTLGIVGMGAIGRSVAPVACGFGMNVLFCDPEQKPECERGGVRQVTQEELFAQADVISLHAPANKATRGMINAESIATMKDGVYLVNTARGTLVDEQAVADALHSGKIAGFATDVVSVEPMRPDNPLLTCKGCNIVITPHISSKSLQTRTRLLNFVVGNVRAFLAGTPHNMVN